MPVAFSSSFPIPVEVDLDYKPDSYFADWCPIAAAVQNVTGEWRRDRMMEQRPLRGRESWWADDLLHDVLPLDRREAHISFDPVRCVSGEYLPPYMPGEFEIARIVLDTTPQVVYSVRARAHVPARRRSRADSTPRKRVNAARVLRVVDEHGTSFTLEKERWSGTCTLYELIRVIDGVRASNLEEQPLQLPFPEALLLEATRLSMPNERLADMVRVSSAVYPELLLFYRARLDWWLQENFRRVPASRRRGMMPVDRLVRMWGKGCE